MQKQWLLMRRVKDTMSYTNSQRKPWRYLTPKGWVNSRNAAIRFTKNELLVQFMEHLSECDPSCTYAVIEV